MEGIPRGNFDFKNKDQILSLEGIIQSCFSNPDRKFYDSIRYASVIKISEVSEQDSALEYQEIQDCLRKMPKAVRRMNRSATRLYPTAEDRKYRGFVDVEQFHSALADSKWYGPFKWSK